MANSTVQRHLTERDVEILQALDRCPLTVRQILKLSQSFPGMTFKSTRSVQDRLQKLRQADWVRRWTYATASRVGAPDYYRLTLLGYRLLHGENAPPPTKRYFNEVGIARHHHTHSLAEFIVHTVVGALQRNVQMKYFRQENSLRIQVGQETLFPDCAFELHCTDGRQFNFFVELDNGTERIQSVKDTDSWLRKIHLYEQYQDKVYPHRFRLLVVATRSVERLQHILAVASAHVRNPQRSLLYAVHLEEYLLEADPVGIPCFRDHRGTAVALISTHARPSNTQLASINSTFTGKLSSLPVATHSSPREPRSSGLPSPTS
jgi:hypothetical protein